MGVGPAQHGMIAHVDLDEVAEDLYALPPEDFVAARTAREKQARADGDRDLAEAVHGLAKPTVVAWLANLLARERRDELAPLLALGADLREASATLAGEDMRRLSQQQHRVVAALVVEARRLAGDAGRPVTETSARGLEETLRAALTDESLSAVLEAGRLSDALQSSGFGTAGNASPGRSKATKPRKAAKPAKESTAAESGEHEQAKLLAAAERDVAEAETAAAEAAGVLEDAEAAAARATRAVDDLGAEVQRLQQEVSRLRADQTAAERAARKAGAHRDRAARAHRVARRARDDAVVRRDKLGS
jgi:flagellin-like hook-associated protein FlgL